MGGFPPIKYCLKSADLKISDIDHMSINIDPKANYIKNLLTIAEI